MDQDQKLGMQLATNEKTCNLMMNSRMSLEKSLNNLGQFIDRSVNINGSKLNKSMSPGYHFNQPKTQI